MNLMVERSATIPLMLIERYSMSRLTLISNEALSQRSALMHRFLRSQDAK